MTYLDRVNQLRKSLGLKTLKRFPSIENRCEHCLSKLTDEELDREHCNTCSRRVDVWRTHSEWDRLKKT